MPSLVSTRTSSISMCRGLPANCGFGPPISNGRLSAIALIEAIVIRRLQAFGLRARVLDHLCPLHEFSLDPTRKVFGRIACNLEAEVVQLRLQLRVLERAEHHTIDAQNIVFWSAGRCDDAV